MNIQLDESADKSQDTNRFLISQQQFSQMESLSDMPFGNTEMYFPKT